MAKVRTTISLDRQLIEDVDALAEEMETTRSSIFFSALKAYVDRYGSPELMLKRINAACEEEPDPADEAFRRAALHYHLRRLGREDWSPRRRR